MSQSAFELLGHDNPLGRYPNPVVPVGMLNGQLVAVFARADGNETRALTGEEEFIHHTGPVAENLRSFDYERDRLFAFTENEVVFYEIASERECFVDLLLDARLSDSNPFLRLALAKSAHTPSLILEELYRCVAFLNRTAAYEFIDEWYERERQSVLQHMDMQDHFRVPAIWKVLLRIQESRRAVVTRPQPKFLSQSGSHSSGGGSAAAMGIALFAVATFNTRVDAERAYRLLHKRHYEYRDVSLLLLEQTFEVAFPEFVGNARVSYNEIPDSSLAKLLIYREYASLTDANIVCAGPYAKNFAGVTTEGMSADLLAGLTLSGLTREQAELCAERLKHGSILMGVSSVVEDDAWYFEKEWLVE
jgi:hypothetical protein